jgi:alkylhydroperoxidase family enzyme
VPDPRSVAPEAFTAVDTVLATTAEVDPELAELARTRVAVALGTEHRQATLPTSDEDRAVHTFAAQFVIDVGSVTEAQRTDARRALGDSAFEFTQLLYVFDATTRLRAAFRQLFDADPFDVVAAPPAGSLWPALESMFAAVARLRALDPVTTEVVRLRGARTHNCRLCKSIRSVRAAGEGADEADYDAIDRYEASALPDRQKVALRLVDAMLWQPTRHPRELRAQVHETFSTEESVEVVLDVARNAANKIAVAFGADDPHVTEGIEYFDTDDDGQLVYGLTLG